jgi:hypothetical protein
MSGRSQTARCDASINLVLINPALLTDLPPPRSRSLAASKNLGITGYRGSQSPVLFGLKYMYLSKSQLNGSLLSQYLCLRDGFKVGQIAIELCTLAGDATAKRRQQNHDLLDTTRDHHCQVS